MVFFLSIQLYSQPLQIGFSLLSGGVHPQIQSLFRSAWFTQQQNSSQILNLWAQIWSPPSSLCTHRKCTNSILRDCLTSKLRRKTCSNLWPSLWLWGTLFFWSDPFSDEEGQQQRFSSKALPLVCNHCPDSSWAGCPPLIFHLKFFSFLCGCQPIYLDWLVFLAPVNSVARNETQLQVAWRAIMGQFLRTGKLEVGKLSLWVAQVTAYLIGSIIWFAPTCCPKFALQPAHFELSPYQWMEKTRALKQQRNTMGAE